MDKVDNTAGTRLHDADQKLVDEFTSSGINRSERKPFRPWWMMMWLGVVIVALGLAARVIGLLYAPY